MVPREIAGYGFETLSDECSTALRAGRVMWILALTHYRLRTIIPGAMPDATDLKGLLG